jgi:hypothetical protein
VCQHEAPHVHNQLSHAREVTIRALGQGAENRRVPNSEGPQVWLDRHLGFLAGPNVALYDQAED